jgi:asparagine synthase (glutamine-hydrolysing)
MCGIAGHLAFPRADPGTVQKMIGALPHRGPDGTATFHEGPVALGHSRLAIIDLQTGDQPKFNEDRQIAVVFNGEIYNYRQLRSELAGRHRFASESDTEVLVHLYEELGEEMVAKLEGMFSFVIWDGRQERLFAARDRFGEKPFLYVRNAQGLFFASELRAFAAAGICSGDINRPALSDYLRLLYVPAPKTIWKDVSKLPAGHAMVADRNGQRIFPYWRPPVPGHNATATLSAARLETELRRAVRSRLRSDVPMGALLSGGVDSSTVVALMAQELGPGVKTFSVGFGRLDDELPFARLMAEKYRTDHHEIIITKDLVTQATEAFGLFSEPFGDSSAVPTAAVFKEVAKHVKVALTGDGGDELFAGYHRRYALAEYLPRLPNILLRWPLTAPYRDALARKARRLVGAMSSTGIARNLALVEVFNPEERASIMGSVEGSIPLSGRAKGNANAAMEFDLGVYLPDDLLTKVDIASMGYGIESRAPLLDHVLAESVIPEPAFAKINKREGKLLLKQAVASLVPDAILKRPKRGFGSPVQQWLTGPLRDFFLDTLGTKNAIVHDWLDPAAIARTVQGTISGRGNAHQAWALLALESWAQRFATFHAGDRDTQRSPYLYEVGSDPTGSA